MTATIRTYSELRRLSTFQDRFQYLVLRGTVGDPTFGFDRWMNQMFYRSPQWRSVRDVVLIRDEGRDLGILGYEIHKSPIIHHMNPMTIEDVESGSVANLDPEFLITTTHLTHNAIHYGVMDHTPRQLVTRFPGDTKLW